MKHLKLIAAMGVFALSACAPQNLFDSLPPLQVAPMAGSDQRAEQLINHEKCPEIEIVEELQELYDFGAAQSLSPQNMASHVTVKKLNASCSFTNKSVTVDIKLAFNAKLGPKGRRYKEEKPFHAYPYFIAIANPNGSIMAKEIFAASVTFDPEQKERAYYEGLRQIIPISSRKQGNRYKVLVGFQLTKEQLAYNREKIAQAALEAQAQKQAAPKKVSQP